MTSVFDKVWHHGQNDPVGDKTDDDANRDREEPQDNGYCPQSAAPFRLFRGIGNLESRPAEKDDQNLPSTHYDADGNEEPILAQSLKDVELVVQTSITIEDHVSIV